MRKLRRLSKHKRLVTNPHVLALVDSPDHLL
jgi:hypothetical protein